MTDYKASHPGSITVQFAVKVIDYFFGLKSISPREDSTVIDLGSGEGFFLETLSRFYRDQGRVQFWGVELNATLYEVSRERLEKLNDRRLHLLNDDFCKLSDKLIERINSCDNVFVYVNNDGFRMADSATNNVADTTETRLVKTLSIYPVGTVLVSLGLLPIDKDDWELQRFCFDTTDIEPLCYAPNRAEMNVYRYEKLSGVVARSFGRSVIRV